MNGTTNQDRTLYYETLPANQLELALFPRERPDEVARHQQGEPRQPAGRGPGRAPARPRQPAVRQDVRADRRAGLRQPGVQALRHRLDGGSQRRVGGRRGDVLQDLLRAEQRRPVDRRRRRHQEDDGADREVLRRDRAAAAIRSVPISPSRRTRRNAAARSRMRWRGCRGSTSPGRAAGAGSPDFDALDVLSVGAVVAAAARA